MRTYKLITMVSSLASTGRVPNNICTAQFAVSAGRYWVLLSKARRKISRFCIFLSDVSKTSKP